MKLFASLYQTKSIKILHLELPHGSHSSSREKPSTQHLEVPHLHPSMAGSLQNPSPNSLLSSGLEVADTDPTWTVKIPSKIEWNSSITSKDSAHATSTPAATIAELARVSSSDISSSRTSTIQSESLGRTTAKSRRHISTFREQLLRRTMKLMQHRPIGTIAVHIKEGVVHKIDPKGELFTPKALVALYIRIHSGDEMKYTGVYNFKAHDSKVTIPFDDLRLFVFFVDLDVTDPYYFVRFEVVAFDRRQPTTHHILASKAVSQLEILQNMCMMSRLDLAMDDVLVAALNVEFCFAYGMFGYGYANQYENRLIAPKERLARSMFFRVSPPPSRVDFTSGGEVRHSGKNII